LVAYTATHFAREEEAMQKRAYPDAAAHLAEHEAFRQEIGEFMDRLRAGDTMLTLGVMKFLKNWLTDHILTVDKRLAAYLNS
jgi:hemerythrin-like metal-binding protein